MAGSESIGLFPVAGIAFYLIEDFHIFRSDLEINIDVLEQTLFVDCFGQWCRILLQTPPDTDLRRRDIVFQSNFLDRLVGEQIPDTKRRISFDYNSLLTAERNRAALIEPDKIGYLVSMGDN